LYAPPRASVLPLFFYCSRALRALHSFPTRRSSDLQVQAVALREVSVLTPTHAHHQGERVGHGGQSQIELVQEAQPLQPEPLRGRDRKSTRLNSSHRTISYAVFCLKKKKKKNKNYRH